MPNQPWRDTRPDAGGLWELGVALTRAQADMLYSVHDQGTADAAGLDGDDSRTPISSESSPFSLVRVPPGSVGARLAERDERTLTEPDPRTPLGRRHGYDLARLAWDDARRTCVECGADCGVSVDHCGQCGYPVCRACGPLVMDEATGDVTVTCAQCAAVGSL